MSRNCATSDTLYVLNVWDYVSLRPQLHKSHQAFFNTQNNNPSFTDKKKMSKHPLLIPLDRGEEEGEEGDHHWIIIEWEYQTITHTQTLMLFWERKNPQKKSNPLRKTEKCRKKIFARNLLNAIFPSHYYIKGKEKRGWILHYKVPIKYTNMEIIRCIQSYS